MAVNGKEKAISSLPACSVQVISDVRAWAALEPEWRELFAASPTAATPLRWEWLQAWWSIFGATYGDGGRGLRIVTVRREGRLVGALPLYLRCRGGALGVRRLGFLSTGMDEAEETCTEYLDLLHAPGAADACLEAMTPVLLSSRELQWDELELENLAADSPLLRLRPLFEAQGCSLTQDEPVICYISDLSNGFEEYLKSLSSGARAAGRKVLRQVESSGMAFELAKDAPEADQFFDQMVHLHKQRWAAAGKPGSFAPRHAEFHHAVARSLVPTGGVILARLTLGGEPYAVTYGHRVGSQYDCYQRGTVLTKDPVESPGNALLLLLMRYLAERGVTTYDHLAGLNQFKERYSNKQREIVSLRAARPNLRLLTSRVTRLTTRVANKAVRVAAQGFKSK